MRRLHRMDHFTHVMNLYHTWQSHIIKGEMSEWKNNFNVYGMCRDNEIWNERYGLIVCSTIHEYSVNGQGV